MAIETASGTARDKEDKSYVKSLTRQGQTAQEVIIGNTDLHPVANKIVYPLNDKEQIKISVDFAQPIADRYSYLTFSIGDGQSFIQNDTIITTPPMTFGGQILGYSIAETSIDPPNTSLEVEVYKNNLTIYPPNELISSTFPIRLQNEKIKIQDSVGGNWNRSFTKGDCFRFKVVNSDNTAKKIQCTISLLRQVEIDAYPKTSPVTISFNIGDGVNPIQSDLSTFSAPLPFSGKIVSYSIANVDTLPQPVNLEIAMLKDNLTNYPPTTEISNPENIKLENEVVKLGEDLSAWNNTIINYNDIIGFKVLSSDNIIKKAIVFVYIEKNQ